MDKGKSSGKSNHIPKSEKQTPKTLGPVPNLEEHVPEDWWRRIFHALYLKTDGDVVDDAKITESEIEKLLDILNPTHDDKVLDLCRGDREGRLA